jgi:hypothetical protein
MKKLNKKLSVTTLAMALVSTVAVANVDAEMRSVEGGHKLSWEEALRNAPIASADEMKKFDLAKTVRLQDLIYTEKSDAPRDEIKAKLAEKAAAEKKLNQTSWSTSLWSKAKLLWTVTLSVAKWTRSLIA